MEGSLGPAESARYVLGIQAGQTLHAKVAASQGQATLSISGADGTVLISPMGGVDRWSGPIPSTQDYYIVVRGAPDGPTRFLLSASVPPLAAAVPTAQRLSFQPGATSAAVQGYLAPGGYARYVLGAGAGQTMEVWLTTTSGGARLTISGADGSLLLSGATNLDQWSGLLQFTEDYFVDVQADLQSGADYVLTVAIPP